MTDFSSYFTSFSLNVFPKHTLCTFKMLPEIYYHGINAYGIYQISPNPHIRLSLPRVATRVRQ